jgi:PEP-CTERM motif
MRKTLFMTTGLAMLALSGAASAAVVTVVPGPMDPQYFASLPAGDNGFTIDGITWTLVSGVAETAKGSTFGVSAAPLGMGTGPTGTTYMSVHGGGTEMASFATPQTSFSFYWGSIDGGGTNSLSITVDGYTLTGGDLMAMGKATADGSQVSPTSNELVTISGLGEFSTIVFHSNLNSFEFSLPTSGVPEPATWAMMALGFAGLGYAAFRRNSKGQISVGAI